MSIAAPDQREWVPILCASKPRQARPMVALAAWRATCTWCEDMCSSLSLCQTGQTGVSSIMPDMSRFNLQSMPIAKQGKGLHHLLSPRMTALCFWSIFCISNVTAKLSANSKLSHGTKTSCPFLKNLMLCKHKSVVHFISLLGTFKY
jgi:hypothetical protein